MTPSKPSLSLGIASVALLVATGCGSGPTYPKEHLAESFQLLLAQEQLNAKVRFVEHTLAVQLAYPNALARDGGKIALGPAFDEASRKTLQVIHRVLLSTDAQIHFYVLLLSDPNVPGAYLTMVRYMDDIRRAYANMLDTTEIFARTIFDVNDVGANTLSIEQYVPRDIQLEEFLSWQLARRIQHALIQELQESGIAMVDRCGGEFREGEFAFTLNIVPQGTYPLDDETIRKLFRASTGVIAKVLASYHFDDFQAVRLIYPPTGRNLVLPKASLKVFR